MNEWHDYGEYIYPLSCVRVMHFPSAFHYYVPFFCSPILHAGETALHTNPACDPPPTPGGEQTAFVRKDMAFPVQ